MDFLASSWELEMVIAASLHPGISQFLFCCVGLTDEKGILTQQCAIHIHQTLKTGNISTFFCSIIPQGIRVRAKFYEDL